MYPLSVGIMDIDFNPRIREGCDAEMYAEVFQPHILIHASARDSTLLGLAAIKDGYILIHASARDATAKSYKIGSDFSALFRKFIQKLGIVIFRISIFLEKQEQYFLFL